MCASILFVWVAAQGPKSGVFNPKLGARLKKYGFEGSQVHPQKVYRRTHSEEGGPGIHPGGMPQLSQIPAQKGSKWAKMGQNAVQMGPNGVNTS